MYYAITVLSVICQNLIPFVHRLYMFHEMDIENKPPKIREQESEKLS